jgi:hypothetical protein
MQGARPIDPSGRGSTTSPQAASLSEPLFNGACGLGECPMAWESHRNVKLGEIG